MCGRDVQCPRCPAAVMGTKVHFSPSDEKKPLGISWEGGPVGGPEPEYLSICNLAGGAFMHHYFISMFPCLYKTFSPNIKTIHRVFSPTTEGLNTP